MNLFIYSSFTQWFYLLFVWYVSDTILGVQHTTVNKTALSDLEELLLEIVHKEDKYLEC